jgi:MoxR-like ATPase
MSNQQTTTEKASASQTTAQCRECSKDFEPTPYKLRKHYMFCDSCIRERRKASGNKVSGKVIIVSEQKRESALGGQEQTKTTFAPSEDITPSGDYIPQNGELDEIIDNIECGLNTLLTGPTQCGKTTLAYHVAKKLGKGIITVQGGAGATMERIIAKDALVERNGVTVTLRPSANERDTWSVLPRAMDKGNCILYVDEPNLIGTDVLAYLYSAMDWRHDITFDDGSVLKAKDGFVCICAMNEGQGYVGTQTLNNAFRARSQGIIDMDYLPAQREAKLVVARTGIDEAMARKLCDAASALRASLKARTITTPIGTSAVLAAAKKIKNGRSVGQAIHCCIVNQVPATKDKERAAVQDTLAAYFGKDIR